MYGYVAPCRLRPTLLRPSCRENWRACAGIVLVMPLAVRHGIKADSEPSRARCAPAQREHQNVGSGDLYASLPRGSQQMFPGARSSQTDHVKRPGANPGADNVQAPIVIPVDDEAAERTLMCTPRRAISGRVHGSVSIPDWYISD